MKRIRVGVIGVGNMGKHHARVYSELENVELIAVADPNRARALEISQQYNCNYYQDFETMLRKEKIGAVSIATPTAMHKQIALTCIEKGVHILIEKPISLNLKDAEEIIDAAKNKKIKLLVGHIERFNPVVSKLKEIMKTGMFGDPIIISATRVGTFPKQIRDMNVVIDLGVHDIDVINFLFGDDVKTLFSQAIVGDDGREYAAQLLLNYADNRVGVIQMNWLTPSKKRRLAINSTKGYIEADYMSQEIVCYPSIEERTHNTYEQLITAGSEEQIIRLKNVEPLKIELSHFIDCILNDKKPLVSGEEGLKVLRIALKSLESIRENKSVTLNENKNADHANNDLNAD